LRECAPFLIASPSARAQAFDISSRRASSADAARSPGNGAFTMIGESATLAAVATPNGGGRASAARHALVFA
jgi:hypothetical protein